MRKIIFIMLLILLALCPRVTAFAADPQFVQWEDSIYHHYNFSLDIDTIFHFINTGDTLIAGYLDTTYVVAETSYVAADTIVHGVDTLLIPADTSYITADTTIAGTDTVAITSSMLEMVLTQWVYIAGVLDSSTGDSVISVAFTVPSASGFPRSSGTWTKRGMLQIENISGTADSMFTLVRLYVTCYPGCSGIPDSVYSSTYNSMTAASDSAAAQGIGDPSFFELKAPVNCAKLVIYGYGANAITTGDGTKARAWIYAE